MHCGSKCVKVWFCNACVVKAKDTNTDAVYLDVNHGQGLLGSAVVSRHSVHGLGNVIQNQVQVYFIFLWKWAKKGYYSHYRLLYTISMCTLYQYVYNKSFSEGKIYFIYFFNFCTVNPLCRILPLKTGNTPTCIINGLCFNCSHRQWYHFLISWLDEACQWAGLCALDSAAHRPWKDAVPSGISAQLFQDFLWFWPSGEPWLIGCFSWARCVGTANRTHRWVTSTRSLMDSRRKVSGSLSDWRSEAWEDTLVSARS